MKTYILIFSVCWCLVMPLEKPKAWETASKQKNDLLGAWVYNESFREGKKLSMENNILALLFKNNTVVFIHNEWPIWERPYKIDSSKNPKWINLYKEEKNEKDVTFGIYEINNGILRICHSSEPNPKWQKRPNEFIPKEGNVMVILKRAKDK